MTGFNNLFFIYAMLPILLLVYFAVPKTKYKNTILIVFSLIFYAWGNPLMLLLLIAFTVVNYFLGRGITKYKGRSEAKILVATGIVLDIGLLFVFKYLGFLTETINGIFKTSIGAPSLLLPLGVSYFTFRAISYLLDVYWEKIESEKYFKDFLLFISFFPCTIAGPIVRYSTIGEELHERHATLEDVSSGLMRFCIGLGKKVIIADQVYALFQNYTGIGVEGASVSAYLNAITTGETWLAILAYSMFVYFDFSGYSDMAIGIAKVLGFHFEENFNYPFVCTSIAEFWQRWHISLGSFFRDYLLYVPIFGKMRRYGGLFLVWFCTGLWHGASWNYIIWGLYFGLFILIEQLLGKKRMKKIPIVVKHIYTKLVIIVGFAIFCFTDLSNLGLCLRNLFFMSPVKEFDVTTSGIIFANIFLLIAGIVFTFPVVPFVKKKIAGHKKLGLVFEAVAIVWCLALLVISSIMLSNSTSSPSLYAQF